jgi:hypothetical protein
MTTLAEQLEADYTALVVEPQYDEVPLQRVSELVAARLIACGAENSGADTEAVELGLDYVTYLIRVRFGLISGAEAGQDANRIDERFDDFRARRMAEASTPVFDEDDDFNDAV